MKLDKDTSKGIKETFDRMWLPALMGAAGTGSVAGYLGSRDQSDAADPKGRRKRILRQALIAAALGGTAGAAIPAGVSMSAGHSSKGPGVMDTIGDKAVGFGARNFLPLAVGGGGAVAIAKHQKSRQAAALQNILNQFSGKLRLSAGHPTISTAGQLKDQLKLDPSLAGNLVEPLRHRLGKGSKHNIYHMYDMLNEAGIKDPETLAEEGLKSKDGILGALQGSPVKGVPREPQRLALAKWLKEQGPVSGLVSKMMVDESGAAPKLREGLSAVGPAYRRLVRPSTSKLPLLMSLGLLGGGTLAAHHVQKRLRGD